MSTRNQLLQLLTANQDKYISGQEIGAELNVSRNAIWKAIEQLRAGGYVIESKTRVGYKLVGSENLLSKEGITTHLSENCHLTVLDTVDSTNNYAKALSSYDVPQVIVSNRQTAGRGRLGRSFASPAGTGLYLSIAIKPDFDLNKSLFVTMAAAVGLCRAIEEVSPGKCKIKWVNDVFINDKKTCGILTEATSNFETGKIDALIIGIGVNCFPGSFPEELNGIAGSVSSDYNSFPRSQLAAEIINQVLGLLKDFNSGNFLAEYRRRCFILGKGITVHPSYDEHGIRANAIDIDENGCLVVEYMEGPKSRTIESLSTGEVSIRTT